LHITEPMGCIRSD